MKKSRHRCARAAFSFASYGAAWATSASTTAASAAVAFATAASAAAAPPSPAAPLELPAAVVRQASALAQSAAAALAPPGARVVATPGALDSRLRLAPCSRIEPFLAAGLEPWGATRVGLRCLEGAAWRAYLPVKVQVLAPAWTSKAALPAGARLTTEQWELAEADWAAAASPPLGAAATIAGRTLARPVAAGQALRETDLQARRWFSSGEAVRIVAAGSGYSITTEGQALGPGIEGQPVRVRTEAGRVLTGLPAGQGLVEVRL